MSSEKTVIQTLDDSKNAADLLNDLSLVVPRKSYEYPIRTLFEVDKWIFKSVFLLVFHSFFFNNMRI
jgi:hypothetical protein